jgi:uncharacterized surface protein with fasciclin (FAS1) repeats
MKIYTILGKGLRSLVMLLLLTGSLWGCKDPSLVETTTADVNISGYMQLNAGEFSEFMKMLELTGNSGFLGAYGAYTVFAPTNEGVQAYLKDKGKASLDQFSVEELRALVRFHVIPDTLSTPSFTDGKISKATMYGQYLTTGATNENGVSRYRINRQANIIRSNVRLGNGVLHVIDRGMEPASQTLAQMIEQNPTYSIFTQALKETGFYDTLNILPANSSRENRKWFTLFAESNATLQKSDINSFADLKSKYSHTGNPKNKQDSLYLFVAYHILPDIKYVADVATAPSHPTLAPMEVVTTRVEGETVLLNADEINGVQEPGTALDRPSSDFSATNGVLHAVRDSYRIKIRQAVPIYWDLGDQPEIRRMADIFRIGGKSFDFTSGMMQNVIFPNDIVKYSVVGNTSSDRYVYGDFFEVNLRSGVLPWIEFKSPLIVKGKYKVWICYRRNAVNDFIMSFNGEPLPRVFGTAPTPAYPGALTVDEQEAQGWKQYTDPKTDRFTGRLLGTIEVKTTDIHTFRITAISNRGGSLGNKVWLDQIHIIPADAPQTVPRFQRDGTPVFTP